VRVRGELEEQTLRSILEGMLDRGVRLQVDSCEPGGGEGVNRWYTIVARGGSGKDIRQPEAAAQSRVERGCLHAEIRAAFRPLTKAK
jgi:23S rRNA pseudouridine2605 synthase